MTNWSTTSAWREVLERIFEGFSVQDNVSPDWLVNPQTNRRLKLDRYYPEAGIAFRFIGLQGKGSYRSSDEEAQQEEDRNVMRDWLCRQQGVTLVQLDVDEAEPARLVQRLQTALSQMSRLLAQGNVSPALKRELTPRLAAARRRSEEVLAQVRKPDGLKLYADLWQDRQYALSSRTSAETAPKPASASRRRVEFQPGMRVQHASFGVGEVMEVAGEGDDRTLVVNFVTAGERRLLARLVGDKLFPAR